MGSLVRPNVKRLVHLAGMQEKKAMALSEINLMQLLGTYYEP